MATGVHTGHRFPKGNPGRPVGSKNKRGLEIKALATRLMTDPEYLAALVKRMREGKAPHMEIFFAQHLWGKPKERIEVTAIDPTVLELIVVEARNGHALSYGNGSNGHDGNGDDSAVIDITPTKEPDEEGGS